MKLFSAIALLSVSGASAFVAPQQRMSSTQLRASEIMDTPEDMMEPVSEPEPVLPEMSQSMPFMKRPSALNGALAGDVGFDPLGFAKSKEDLMNFREAEIKHARLAMLAAAGWPLSEVFDKKIAGVLGLNPLLDSADRVPSLLNGGLGKVNVAYWAACVGIAAAVDLYGISRKSSPGYTPGDLGFDPLGVMPKDEAGMKNMQLAEIKNGRLAMIAITAFAVQEAVSTQGIVDETPLFFFPIAQTLHQYANTGYIQ